MNDDRTSMDRSLRNLLLSLALVIAPSLPGCSRGSGETIPAASASVASTAARVVSGSSTTSALSGPEPSTAVSPSTPEQETAASPAVSPPRGPAPAAATSPEAAADRDASRVARDSAATAGEAGLRILVSIAKRRLWLVDGTDTLLRAPVAIGMGKDFTYNGRRYHFATPKGTRKVLSKAKDPLWTVPEWHYYEKAAAMGLSEVVKLDADATIVLGDSSLLTIRDHQVGRVNHHGYFAPFTPGTEIVFDDRMYIPPISTAQRRVPNALGPYKLDMGDGYLIHGTHIYNEETIGDAVSHGCVRMRNEDLTRLYPLVPRGTPVIIF